MNVRIPDIDATDQCDDVTADDIEHCRKQLGFTPRELAETLGWSTRKYHRTLEAAREDGAAPRDVVLSVIGLTRLMQKATRSRLASAVRPAPSSFFEAGG